MVAFYVMLVKNGTKDLSEVPPKWRADVEWEIGHGEKENLS